MIKLTHVYKEYQVGEDLLVALKNINLEISKGEFTAIYGPSGSGKSTLMQIIGLLDTPTRGNIYIEGKDVSKLSDDELSRLRNEFVGFVFQQFNLIAKLTVFENILLPTLYTPTDVKAKDRASFLMERFGIADKANTFPNKISGGQQQRVAIARALINNPRVILADEPTGNLDTKTGLEIMKLLSELNIKDRTTVVVVTHETQVAKFARRKIQLLDGRIL